MATHIQVTVNGQEQQFPATVTVAELLKSMQVPARSVAVEINLEIVPRTMHEQRCLNAGDAVEIVSLVGGG